MAVNWSLLQPVDIGGMFQQGYQQGQQLVEKQRLKSALAAFSADPSNPQAQSALAAASPEYAYRLATSKQEEAQKAAERQRIASYFADPDLQTSRKRALAEGDIDVAKELAGLSEEQQKQAREEAKAIAPAAYQALKLPYEQRKPYLRSIAPQLAAVGYTPEEIEAFDPTDQALNGFIQVAQTLEQAREQDRVHWVTDPQGGQFPTDYFGHDVSGRPGGGPPVRQAASTGAPGSLQFTPVAGAQMTSGYRTPEHNAEVGGVSNSFHMRRGADGEPMARDFVPPPGMSMGELHAKLSAANPHLDVINEGDHVHIEPKPGARPVVNDAQTLIQKAQEAIAAGADPAAVKARLASMGVQM